MRELDRRILEVLDEYILTDHQRLDRPVLGGIVVLHQLADPAAHSPANGIHPLRPDPRTKARPTAKVSSQEDSPECPLGSFEFSSPNSA